MNSYAEIYTQYGLTEMIHQRKDKIRVLELERDDIGKWWTESHINSHQKAINEEIVHIHEDILELEEALQIRQQLNLR